MSTKREAYLTRCPVGNATEIAVQKGFLFEEFRKKGAELRLLQALPPERWEIHFTHGHPAFFRDGGNIPPIWARSLGADSRVIGLNFNERRTGILVRGDAPYRSIGDLAGKRFSLPVRRGEKIDFWRAAALKGITSSLAAAGLGLSDVSIVEQEISDPYIASSTGEAHWDSVFPQRRAKGFQREETEALADGRVDAIFGAGAWGERLVLDGRARYLHDLQAGQGGDRTNIEHPSTITVSGKFADENRDLVVAYLRTLLFAARWAKENREEVVGIYAKGSWLDDVEAEGASRPADFHERLAPELSGAAVAALVREKEFLREHGFLGADFSVADWIDGSFLEEAVREDEESAGAA
jgi:ABC-type nitrate/sulfonate/bicarbonate transport system substrate-binding protein